MRVSILQPSYLPWLGYFDLMSRADTFVFLDDVQFTRRDWRNRNKIRTREGWAWLTVPVVQKNRFAQKLCETRIDNSIPWKRKHLESLRVHYARAPYFDLYFPYFDSLYNRPWDSLGDLCFETLGYLKECLKIETPTLKSSELQVGEAKAEKIISLCRRLGATHYLSGDAGQSYLSPDDFKRQGITLEFHQYRHPEYGQRFPGFVSYLSVIDLLFNHGDRSPEILRTAALQSSGTGLGLT